MIVDVSTTLDCSAAKAWNEVQKTSLHRHTPFPERWTEGLTVQCKLFIFQVIPLGVHTLHLETIDQKSYEIQSREYDPLIARWDHLVSIKPIDDARCLYRDMIDVDAGRLTFVVWAWANWFYRHRQWRWRALAKKL
jgi:hypothetical protein